MTDLRAGVHPLLLSKIDKVLAVMVALGHPMRICQGLRTVDQQQKLWFQGRNELGVVINARAVVTNADGIRHKSNHQDGNAVDCCFQGDDPFLEHDRNADALWFTFASLVCRVGLVSGADFPMVDMDHAELPKLASSKGPALSV